MINSQGPDYADMRQRIGSLSVRVIGFRLFSAKK